MAVAKVSEWVERKVDESAACWAASSASVRAERREERRGLAPMSLGAGPTAAKAAAEAILAATCMRCIYVLTTPISSFFLSQ